MAYDTGRTGWNRRGTSAMDEIAASIDYQTKLHDANGFYYRQEYRAARYAWEHCGVSQDVWQAFQGYFAAYFTPESNGNFKALGDVYKIALEAYERTPDITAEALAQEAGILPECNCATPEQHCPACEAAARKVYGGSGEELPYGDSSRRSEYADDIIDGHHPF